MTEIVLATEHRNMSSEGEHHQPLYNTTITMNPRISFSSDFADPRHQNKLVPSYREAPVSSDFEFSVPSHSMMSADKLFFNGKMLPLRASGAKPTTLRDELLTGDNDHEHAPPIFKFTSRWRERLGLKRSSSHLKKGDKDALASRDESQ